MYHNARLAAMGEMIGNIAHQWRQPLNALTVLIQGFGTKSMTGKLNQEFIDKQVNEGLRLANQMSTTIEDFRNFFSPHDKRDYFNVRDSLGDTLELVEFFAKDEHIDIQVIYDAELRVYGYSNEFAQVIFNLINNARDNFKQRDIKEDRKILIKLEKKKKNHKERAIISFTDNGGGVDPKIKDRIFEPYFTTKHKSTGTGIGLYMSKQIIEKQMQGLVTMKNIKSKLGGDKDYNCAQFIIVIPIR
jgi:signal transduction histidine kinase